MMVDSRSPSYGRAFASLYIFVVFTTTELVAPQTCAIRISHRMIRAGSTEFMSGGVRAGAAANQLSPEEAFRTRPSMEVDTADVAAAGYRYPASMSINNLAGICENADEAVWYPSTHPNPFDPSRTANAASATATTTVGFGTASWTEPAATHVPVPVPAAATTSATGSIAAIGIGRPGWSELNRRAAEEMDASTMMFWNSLQAQTAAINSAREVPDQFRFRSRANSASAREALRERALAQFFMSCTNR